MYIYAVNIQTILKLPLSHPPYPNAHDNTPFHYIVVERPILSYLIYGYRQSNFTCCKPITKRDWDFRCFILLSINDPFHIFCANPSNPFRSSEAFWQPCHPENCYVYERAYDIPEIFTYRKKSICVKTNLLYVNNIRKSL